MDTPSHLVAELEEDKKLGMWFFIAAEVVIFASLFGVFLTLRSHIADGPTPKGFIELKSVVVSTVILLSSSLTIYLADQQKSNRKAIPFLVLTLLLGTSFLFLEIREFHHYYLKGHILQTSPFLSSFYLLVGTHGAHVLAGTVWMILLFIHMKRNKNPEQESIKLSVFSLYWHFVDLMWVLIFTLVYLYGEVG